MQSLHENAVVIISGAKRVTRSGDQYFPFWQNANFHYLTAWPEFDAVLVMQRQGNDMRSLLFHQGYDPADAKWHGECIAHEAAVQQYGFDQALPRHALDQWLKQNIQVEPLYLTADADLPEILNNDSNIDQSSLDFQLMKQRLYKSTDELKAIELACKITVEAHLECMRQGVRGKFTNEQAIAATFEYQCAMRQAEGMAYEIIAAAGNRACTLHYTKNNAEIMHGDCVLLDAGCTVAHYCADVTRCWPTTGKFTAQQKVIYQLVLQAQQACIKQVAAGVAFRDLQAISQSIMIDGLRSQSIVDKSASTESLFEAFYGHGIGHAIGLDVHDPSPRRKDFLLEENMVITVEPGLYLRDCPLLIDKSFAGIGIRIEDNVLVQEKQGKNLTAGVPVDPDVIESLAYE